MRVRKRTRPRPRSLSSEKNFGLKPFGDIRQVKLKDIPKHDVLCAGFSLASHSQRPAINAAWSSPEWGDLIDYVIDILHSHKPQYFIIENVPNLVWHNRGRTWKKIKERLQEPGYAIDDRRTIPGCVRYPGVSRESLYGRSSAHAEDGYRLARSRSARQRNFSILETCAGPGSLRMPAKRAARFLIEYLDAWQTFLDQFPKKENLPSFPVWAMEFGATYPYTDRAPFASGFKNLGRYRGSFGCKLSGLSPDEVRETLPRYARYEEKQFPEWKVTFIRKNRAFYKKHKRALSNDNGSPTSRNLPLASRNLSGM